MSLGLARGTRMVVLVYGELDGCRVLILEEQHVRELISWQLTGFGLFD